MVVLMSPQEQKEAAMTPKLITSPVSTRIRPETAENLQRSSDLFTDRLMEWMSNDHETALLVSKFVQSEIEDTEYQQEQLTEAQLDWIIHLEEKIRVALLGRAIASISFLL